MHSPADAERTDFSAARYWTVVAEMGVQSVEDFERMMRRERQSPTAAKQIEKIMSDYHDLVESGRREIFKIEG